MGSQSLGFALLWLAFVGTGYAQLQAKSVPILSLIRRQDSVKRSGWTIQGKQQVGGTLEHLLAVKAAADSSINGSISTAFANLTGWCADHTAGLAAARREQRDLSASLSTRIAQQSATQTKLGIEDARLRRKLSEQRDSYSSTLSLQQAEESSFEKSQQDNTERATLIRGVLKKLNERVAVEGAAKALSLLDRVAKDTAPDRPRNDGTLTSALVGSLRGALMAVELDLKESVNQHKVKQKQYSAILASYREELNRIEASAESVTKRLRSVSGAVASAELEQSVRSKLLVEDTELLSAVTTMCGEVGFAVKKRLKVNAKLAANLDAGLKLLRRGGASLLGRPGGVALLQLRMTGRHKSAGVKEGIGGTLGAALAVDVAAAELHSDALLKVAAAVRVQPALDSIVMLTALRKAVAAEATGDAKDVAKDCRAKVAATVAELWDARSQERAATNAAESQAMNATSLHAVSKVVDNEIEPVAKISNSSATLADELRDARNESRVSGARALRELTEAERGATAELRVLLTRIRHDLEDWSNDGLDDVHELEEMIHAVGKRTDALRDTREARAAALAAAARGARRREGQLNATRVAAEKRRQRAEAEENEIEARCRPATGRDLSLQSHAAVVRQGIELSALDLALRMLEPVGHSSNPSMTRQAAVN